MTGPKLTSAEVTYLLVEAEAVGKLTVTEHGDYVRITGPKDDRTRAFHVLFDQGLTVAPYTDHDDWTRSTTDKPQTCQICGHVKDGRVNHPPECGKCPEGYCEARS